MIISVFIVGIPNIMSTTKKADNAEQNFCVGKPLFNELNTFSDFS